jgi:hypothetical protein
MGDSPEPQGLPPRRPRGEYEDPLFHDEDEVAPAEDERPRADLPPPGRRPRPRKLPPPPRRFDED